MWPLFIILLITTCTCKNRRELTAIEINCRECKGKVAELSSFDLLVPENLKVAEGQFDSSGRVTLHFNIPSDCFLSLRIDSSRYHHIYTFAGETTKISFVNNTPQTKGKNEALYHYVSDFENVIDSLINVANTKRAGSDMIPVSERSAFFEKICLPVRHFENRFKADAKLLPDHKKILLLQTKTFRQWLMQSFMMVETEATYGHWQQAGNKTNGFAPDFFKNVGVSPEGISGRFPFYFDLVNSELLHHLWKPIEFHLDETGSDYDDGMIGLQCAQVITNAHFPDSLAELLHAKSLYYCLQQSAVTPSSIELYDRFIKRYPKSVFAARLKKQLAESKALSEGEPAKDFEGFKVDGKRIKLSELKGKVVYVDFWATWCKPCIEEFPHSKKLINRFEHNDGVVFLFVSFDKDLDKWKKFLAKKAAPSGLHIIVDKNGHSGVDAYQITGIPHYLLVDDLGNIKSANAMRPSQPEVIQILDQLLNTREGRKN